MFSGEATLWLTSRYHGVSSSSQLHPFVQIWSILALWKQNNDGHIAKLQASKRWSTNQWLTVTVAPLTSLYSLWYNLDVHFLFVTSVLLLYGHKEWFSLSYINYKMANNMATTKKSRSVVYKISTCYKRFANKMFLYLIILVRIITKDGWQIKEKKQQSVKNSFKKSSV